MPKIIEIESTVSNAPAVQVELVYSSGPSVFIEILQPEPRVIDVSFAAVGAKGDPGEGTAISVPVTENVAAFKAVTADGKVADSSNLSHRLKVIGITAQAISNGFAGEIKTGGNITNPSWTWITGDRIYINQKNLSSVEPTAADSIWSQQVGIAINSTTITIQLKQSILL